MDGNLSQLLATPLQPLREQWRSAAQAELLRTARARHDESPDAYWAWVAERQRWLRPPDTVRTGELGDFTYFAGGQINVADNCVDRWADDPATAGRAAVIWEGEPGDVRTVTYAELAGEVSRLAGALVALGVTKGDVVAIYMPNAIEAFTAVHACNRIGAIYTILFSGFGPDAVLSRLEAARARVVLVLDASYRRGRLVPLLETLRTAREKVSTLRHTIVVDRTGRGLPLHEQDGEISYQDALALAPDGTSAVPLEANDPAFLIFTSGTEARPKGVVHSVAGFLLGTWANVRWQIAPEPDDGYWVAADVGWLTFPIQAVVGGLANGMTVVCFEGAMDTPSTARFYEICEKHRVTKVLGAPTLLRMLRKYGDELAAAHPLPGLRLVTVQGEPLDADGHLWVLGRADDVINVAAHRISTLAIEAIATAHPQVAEAAVVGVADPTKGTVPVAFLTLLDGADPGAVRQEVNRDVTSQLGGYARLGAVYLTVALPKTRTGKTMRRLLRDVIEHGGPQGDTSALEDTAGLQAVQQAVAADSAQGA
jgi:acetyl-CoA synthetase